jgi:hypothetical protein
MPDVAMFKVLSARKSAMMRHYCTAFAQVNEEKPERGVTSDQAQMSQFFCRRRWIAHLAWPRISSAIAPREKPPIKCFAQHSYTKVYNASINAAKIAKY